jgi:hypothetical protein
MNIPNAKDRIVPYIFADTLEENFTLDATVTGARTPLNLNSSSYGSNANRLKIVYLGK